MPGWKTAATKMLHSLSNHPPRERKTSIDVHVTTQRSFFVEPPTKQSAHVGHRHRLRQPYAVPPKYEKEFARPRPKPLKIWPDENTFPVPVDEKGKGLVDRRRRYGMQCYPEGVREELRRARTKSLRLAPVDTNSPRINSPRFKPDRKSPNADSSSVYSDKSGFGDIIVSSAPCDKEFFEPPSWFSDHSLISESGDPSRFSTSTTDDYSTGQLRHMEEDPEAGSSLSKEPPTAKSWETFRIPSLPPSPVDSVASTITILPRDPRLPPADYLLYKEMYDDAMIKLHGKLPVEWIAYTRRHYTGQDQI